MCAPNALTPKSAPADRCLIGMPAGFDPDNALIVWSDFYCDREEGLHGK